MGLIQSIAEGLGGFRADVSGAPAPWDDYWYNPVGGQSSAGMRISAETVKSLAAVYACVGIIARNIAMMPCKIYTDVTGGGKKVVPYHPVYDLLLTKPNAQQTAFEFKQMMQGWLELRGNAYAEIVSGPRGEVDQLLPMHPDRVQVERLKPSGRLRYVYNDPLTNETRKLMQDEVLHLRNFSDDGATGQSTIALGAEVFGVALAQQDYAARFLGNDAKPSVVITGTNFKAKQDRDEFRDSWQESQTGKNRHKAAILPQGVDVKTISVSPTDAQLLESRKFSRIEICSMFGVPPHLIGETEKTATYASVEQFNLMFAVQCILPRLILWEQVIQRDLILNPRFYPKFSMAVLLRGDNAARSAFYKAGFESGYFCPNDIREMEDLNPIANPAANNYFRPGNIVPLEQTASPAAPPPASADEDESDTADPDDDPSVGDGEQASMQRRFSAMAAAGVERCIRKEVAACQKLRAKNATQEEYAAFYLEHAQFVSDVLSVPLEAAQQWASVRMEMASANTSGFPTGDLLQLAMKGAL